MNKKMNVTDVKDGINKADKDKRILDINDRFENWYNYRCFTTYDDRYNIISENLIEFEDNIYKALMFLSNRETYLKSYFLESQTNLMVEFELTKMYEYYENSFIDEYVTVGKMLEYLLTGFYHYPHNVIDSDLYYIYSVSELNKDYKVKIDNLLIKFRKSGEKEYLIIEFENKENKETFIHYLIDLV